MNMQSMISKLTVSDPQGLLKQFIFTSDIKGKNECNKSQRKLKSLNFRLWFWFWFAFFDHLCTNSKMHCSHLMSFTRKIVNLG